MRVEGRGTGMSATLVAHEHEPYAPELRQAIFRTRASSAGEPVRLNELARLARQISLAYAAAVAVLFMLLIRPRRTQEPAGFDVIVDAAANEGRPAR